MRRLIILIFLLCGTTQAANRYVDVNLSADCTSGNYSIASRNCTGSDGNGYRTFNLAAPGTVAGDTVFIRGGTYPAGLNCQSVTCNDGTAGSHIRWQNYNSESVTVNTSLNFYDQNVQYWDIVGSSRAAFVWDMNKSGSAGNCFQLAGAAPNGADNILLDTMTCRESNDDGLFARGNNNTIRNILFSDNGDPTDSPATHGIYFSQSNSNNIVEDSEFVDCGANCIQFYDTTSTSSGNIVRRNIWRNQSANSGFAEGGLSFRGQVNFKAYNNLQYHVLNSDGGTYCIDSLSANTSPEIYNNDCIGNGSNKGILITAATNAIVRNNLVWNHTSNFVNTGTGTTCSNNLTNNSVPAGCANSVTATSPFVSLAGENFNLIAGAAAIGTGFNVISIVTDDITKATRTVPLDIGAYKYVSLTPSISLVTPDGGESWQQATTQTISYTFANVSNVDIDFDPGNDGTYEVSVVAGGAASGSYSWTVPSTPTTTGRIRVKDSASATQDTSAAVFSITAGSGGQVTLVISDNTTGVNAGDSSGTEDSYMYSLSPTLNLGAETNFYVSKPSGSDHSYALLRFQNIPTLIAPGSTIDSVQIGFYLQDSVGATAQTFDLRRVVRTWNEGQVTFNQYTTGNNWTTPGGLSSGNDRIDTASAQITGIGTTPGFYSVTSTTGLKDDFQALFIGTYSDLSYHIEVNGTPAAGSYRGFTSSEGTNGQRPFARILYTAPAANITVVDPTSTTRWALNTVSPVPIRWNSNGTSGQFKIEILRYNLTGGGNLGMAPEVIIPTYPYNGSDASWTVKGPACNACILKVTSLNDPSVIGYSAPFVLDGTLAAFTAQ